MPRRPDDRSRAPIGRIAADSYLVIVGVALASFLFFESPGELGGGGLALTLLALPWDILFDRLPPGTPRALGYVLYPMAALVNSCFISFFLGSEFFWFRRSKNIPSDRSENSR